LKHPRLIYSKIAKVAAVSGSAVRKSWPNITSIAIGLLSLVLPISAARAGWFYYVVSTKGGAPAFIKLEYNSHFACQDWLGYCIPNPGYPTEMPFGACGEDGIGVGSNGYVGTLCGRDSTPLSTGWSYFFYPSEGGVYSQKFAGAHKCAAVLDLAQIQGHPPMPKFREMTGTFSTKCVFAGQTFE